MALTLNLSVTMTDCCDTLELCDTTADYGLTGNPLMTDVVSTKFTIMFPDGSTLLNLDLGFNPNTSLCKSVTLADIYTANGSPAFSSNPGPKFADGVYTFLYAIFDFDGIELARVTKKVLFNCIAITCLKSSLLTGEDCGCGDGYDNRILKTRLKIEQAKYQFEQELYECANETILKAGKMCNDICLDC